MALFTVECLGLWLECITESWQQQAQGIGEVNAGVSQLEAVIQNNAGSSQELAAASEESANQVASLRDVIGMLHVS